MSNVRKQTIVISVLIVLIACAGWFAKSFNDTIKDTNALSEEVTKTNTTMNFFADSRIQRDSKESALKEELNGIISNKELGKKAREEASASLIQLVGRSNKESQVETLVKECGFEDALCMINDKNVEVCVKVSGEINSSQVHKIKDIVVRTTQMSPSNIYVKPKQ